MELKQEVKVFLTEIICDETQNERGKPLNNGEKCGGKYKTGSLARGYDTEHICDKCGKKRYFRDRYPKVTYEPVQSNGYIPEPVETE